MPYVLLIDNDYLQDVDSEEAKYAALNFSTRKVKRVREMKELRQESIYSAVRADYHT